MDINNKKTRKIVCVSNDDSYAWGFSGTGHLLTVGAEYTVTDIEVYDWYTTVTLKEFPDVEFNSVLFEEVNA